MGARGPAPSPTAIKRLHAVKPGRINAAEPTPELEDLVAPARLSGEALDVWNYFAPRLERKHVATSWDVDSLASYCIAEANYREAVRHLDEEGKVVDTPVFARNGELAGYRQVTNPWWKIMLDSEAIKARIGARFGLTPSERSNLKVGDNGKPNGKARLLSG